MQVLDRRSCPVFGRCNTWQDAGYYSLAQISVSRDNWEEALEEIEKSLLRNWHNLRGRHLKAMILRHLERPEEALAWIEDSLKIDAFNFGCLFEKYLMTREETVLSQLRHLIKRGAPDYEALVLDYTSAGRFEEALAVAELAIGQPIGEQTLLHYYKSWCLIRLGETDKARTAIRLAEKEPADYCFPNALEAIEALQCVADFMGEAPKALYYLGNLWYDKRQYTPAIAAWERSSREDETFPLYRWLRR
jgi:tetratricopeptide (TPR) repeat protein